MAKKLKVTLVRSGSNRPKTHKLTVRHLGLHKVGRVSILPDNPAVRGMIKSVIHMVKVEATE